MDEKRESPSHVRVTWIVFSAYLVLGFVFGPLAIPVAFILAMFAGRDPSWLGSISLASDLTFAVFGVLQYVLLGWIAVMLAVPKWRKRLGGPELAFIAGVVLLFMLLMRLPFGFRG